MEWDASKPWYHRSPLLLTSIRAGSTIKQDRELAPVFSHKPALVVQNIDDAGNRRIKHAGRQRGFLYQIVKELQRADVDPHPQTTMAPGQEWVTTREPRVQLIDPTAIVAEEVLAAAEIEELRHRSAAARRTGHP